MSLVECGKVLYPDPNRLVAFNAFSTNAGYQINGSGHRIGYIFSVRRSGTITKVGVRINTCASAVTSRAGLYTVDSAGDPTSTAYGGSAYGTFTPAANTYSEITLATPATATQGDLAALVIEFDSSAGDMFVTGANNTWWTATAPYFDKYNGATWAKNSSGSPWMGHLYYSDGGGFWADFTAAPFTAVPATGTYNTGSTPDERALKITVPFACRVAGAWTCFHPATSADYEAVLYSGTTALKTIAVVAATSPGTSNTVRQHYFATGQSLAAGDVVRACIKPTTANNVTYRQYPTYAAGSEQGLGVGQGTFLSTRTDAGSWTDTATTTFPLIGLIIDQLDDGAGGGGTVYVPNSGIFTPMWRG